MFEGLLQPLHLLVILGILLIFFGPGKLPELGSGIGKAMREFKKSLADIDKPVIENDAAKTATSDESCRETKSS